KQPVTRVTKRLFFLNKVLIFRRARAWVTALSACSPRSVHFVARAAGYRSDRSRTAAVLYCSVFAGTLRRSNLFQFPNQLNHFVIASLRSNLFFMVSRSIISKTLPYPPSFNVYYFV